MDLRGNTGCRMNLLPRITSHGRDYGEIDVDYWKDMPAWQKALMTVIILPIMALTIVGLPVVVMTILDILEEEAR